MDKDLLEMQVKHLNNVLKECDPKQVLNAEEKFKLAYTCDAVGMCDKKLTIEDVERINKIKVLPDFSEREQKEILNHLKAFEFVQKEVHDNRTFSEEFIKDIHEMLVKGIFPGGIYRNVNISIFGAAHQPPDYVKVYTRMGRFFNDIQRFEGSDLEKATYAHASIAKIHPFIDANGRLAKLVLNYFLMKSNYLPISIPLDQMDEYIRCLETFKGEKDLNPLTDFFKNLLVHRYEEMLQELDV
ncbi:MAG: Fic family protein [Acholeplasmataceae bacterium]